MKRSHLLFITLIFIALVISARAIAALQAPHADGQAQTASEARGVLDGAVTVHAAGRMNPSINLRDGHSLPVDYQGGTQAIAALRDGGARPVALATADFDEDGMADLVTGYGSAGGGVVVLQRGDVDAVYPNTEAAAAHRAEMRAASLASPAEGPSPFLVAANVLAIYSAPQFMAAGDFDADGHADLITCEIGATSLGFLKGDGRGGLEAGRALDLPGKVTAITVADVNRMDGLADIVVAVATASGARLLVFEDRFGALSAAPEIINLPAAASALTTAQLDDDYPVDIAAACGRDLLVVRGRDRHHATLEGQQHDAEPPAITRLRLTHAIVALTAGDFLGDDHYALAALADNGVCHLLSKAMDWKEASAVRLPVNLKAAANALPPALLALHLSGAQKDDLLLVDRAAQRLHVLINDAAESSAAASPMSIAGALDVEGEPTAVLPMRLNSDGLDDLIILRDGASLPSVLATAPLATFVVTNTNDSGAGSLRQAITSANQSAGADAISFSIPGVGTQTINLLVGLPTIIGTVTIDGTTQNPQASSPPIELNGSGAPALAIGLNISASSCVVRGLVVNRFDGSGISLGSGSQHIEGCYIGTDATGTALQGNGEQGVAISSSSNSTVGGTTVAARNVISGNSGNGVLILGPASNNLVQGNFIGTNAAGTQALGNSGDGIEMVSGSNSVTNCAIGGTAAGAGNVISGNNGSGVQFFGVGTGNLIQGNLIGTSASGTQALGNLLNGVVISDATGTTIGGSVATATNIISGNGTEGVRINNTTATGNAVKGNRIGTRGDGTAALPNAGDGVVVINSAANNTIGGVAGEGNLIAFNSGVGVRVDSGTGNAILTNAIYANQGLGIDLTPAGVTANDLGDGDNGANNLQNFPVLQTANSVAGGSMVQGTLNSTASATFTIQFFANDVVDASGNGEGQLFIGSTSVTTNASGNASFNAPLTGSATTGQFISATATNAQGNTSEFSACIAYGAADMSVTKTVAPSPALAGSTVTYTITVTNNGADTAQTITLTDNLPAAVAFASCTATGGGVCGGLGNNRTVSFASMAAGASATVTITATLNCTAANGASINNVASVTSATRDPASGNNSASAAFTASNPPAMLSPTSDTFASDGGTASVQVILFANCPWTAQSQAPWIVITSLPGGNGNGSVNYRVDPNNTGSPRSGTMTVAGQTFTVNQTTTPCQYTLNPPSANYPAAGGSSSVNVTALTGCFWKPNSNDTWIIVASGGATGSGAFNYTVLANPDGLPRTGTVTVGPAIFSVTQAAAPCVFTLSPTGKLMDLVGSESSFDLLCPNGCNWNATASDAWITITSDDSGSGPATINFLVRDNPDASPRQGSISVGGQSFTIVQDSTATPDCNFQIAPVAAAYNAAAGNGSLQIIAEERCPWEAVSNASWTHVTGQVVGIGTQVITYHVDANLSRSARATTIRVGGQTFRIKQKGM
jgi:uncharacterized repeat protein (TIGR01451 family)